MDPENQSNEVKLEGEEAEKDFENKKVEGKEFLSQELHNKAKLSSLRSYQSDMAEFIKEKNESVLSIAAKEKKRKDEQKNEEEKLIVKEKKPKPKSESFQVNFTVLLSSILLLVGGAYIGFYIYERLSLPPTPKISYENKLLPFIHQTTLANASKETIESELKKIPVESGLTEIIISDVNGKRLDRSGEFVSLVGATPPSSLLRTLRDDYAVGIISKDDKQNLFVILTSDDFGLTFSSMLEWEKTLARDFSFMANKFDNQNALVNWKDVIVKNKDARVFSDAQNNIWLAYAFLDKNTVLITDSANIIGDIASLYANRSFTR